MKKMFKTCIREKLSCFFYDIVCSNFPFFWSVIFSNFWVESKSRSLGFRQIIEYSEIQAPVEFPKHIDTISMDLDFKGVTG